MRLLRIAFCVLGTGLACKVWGQTTHEIRPGWHLLDRQKDGYFGISLGNAYERLKGKKSQEVIVAVLDGGVDTTHEDLKTVLWHNPKERLGNKTDDDKNGYADDLYGWNFLGNPNGSNVEEETAEAVRLYHQLKPWWTSKGADTLALKGPEAEKYQLWKKVNASIETSQAEQFNLRLVQSSYKSVCVYDSVIREQWGRAEYTPSNLEDYKPCTPEGKKAKMSFLRFMDLLQLDKAMTNKEIFNDLREYIDRQVALQLAKEAPVVKQRWEVTADDENNWNTRSYGNADVMGKSSTHGTHISGIIAADRTNHMGIEGIADHAKIMVVRMVPQGDEYDKDVALGIRYAVDNGAKVINMSFGKEVSPNKEWVDEAIRYAAQHDVLIIHAAGNDAENMDVKENYPSARLNDNSVAANLITVGASSDYNIKGEWAADFTNYGAHTVDVMAPGVKIYSTVPVGNGYQFLQGTSMAAPVVAGIAALLRSYYPSLSAVQVKQIIEQSADRSLLDTPVQKPGGKPGEIVSFGSLSKTGAIVNAFNAVQMAEEAVKGKSTRYVQK